MGVEKDNHGTGVREKRAMVSELVIKLGRVSNEDGGRCRRGITLDERKRGQCNVYVGRILISWRRC